jgi:hypothetical protein
VKKKKRIKPIQRHDFNKLEIFSRYMRQKEEPVTKKEKKEAK